MSDRILSVALAVGTLASGGAAAQSSLDRPQYESTYERREYPPVLLQGATVMTGTGEEIEGASVALRDGRIVGVGRDVKEPPGAIVIDATGKFVTPGIIDTHSHLGVYAAPATPGESDGNESIAPDTSHVWAEHSFWPQDPHIPRAVAGGVTTIQVLPGSANLFGGRGVTVRLVPARSVQEMKFPGAPHSLKMACGENPKRVYGGQKGGPRTRMGNVAGYRKAFIAAEEYARKWEKWRESGEGDPPTRDLGKETLAGALSGEILVHNHCYRADEMLVMLDVAREFDYQIRSFHHAIEAYKIAPELAAANTGASIWADRWGFKEEAMDGIIENAAILERAGGKPIIHSDSAVSIQRLNQEAAKAMYAGQRAGIDVDRADAMRWITANPAWALGIDEVTGTLEEGKAADVVLWSGDPFSVYSVAEQVYNEGWLAYDRGDADHQPTTDFELGRSAGAHLNGAGGGGR